MNKHILMLIDHQINPKKYTKAQLDKNANAAYVAYNIDYDDYLTAYDSAYYAAYYAAYAGTAQSLDKYFELTGESKKDYINAINKDNKQ